MDGRLGKNNITGPGIVPWIRQQTPEMIIIGILGEDKYNEEFKELEVDSVLNKDFLTTYINQILSLTSRNETDLDFDNFD